MKEAITMKNTNLPLDVMYEDMGKQAFEAGKKRFPAGDEDIMKEIAASRGNGSSIAKLWLIGWDKANIAAPV